MSKTVLFHSVLIWNQKGNISESAFPLLTTKVRDAAPCRSISSKDLPFLCHHSWKVSYYHCGKEHKICTRFRTTTNNHQQPQQQQPQQPTNSRCGCGCCWLVVVVVVVVVVGCSGMERARATNDDSQHDWVVFLLLLFAVVAVAFAVVAVAAFVAVVVGDMHCPGNCGNSESKHYSNCNNSINNRNSNSNNNSKRNNNNDNNNCNASTATAAATQTKNDCPKGNWS